MNVNSRLLIDAALVVVGAVMYVLFGFILEIETPIIGLRQVGAVIAVIGVVDFLAVWWSRIRRRNSYSGR